MGQTYCARPDTIGEWPGLRPSRTAPASSGEAGGLRWAGGGAAVIRRPSKPDRLAGTTSGRLPLAALMARATFFDDLGNKVPEVHTAVSYTHLRAHETVLDLVCRL